MAKPIENQAAALERIADLLQEIGFGSIIVTVKDSKVVALESSRREIVKPEKISKGHGREVKSYLI